MNLFDIQYSHAYIKTVPQFMWAPCGWVLYMQKFLVHVVPK